MFHKLRDTHLSDKALLVATYTKMINSLAPVAPFTNMV